MEILIAIINAVGGIISAIIGIFKKKDASELKKNRKLIRHSMLVEAITLLSELKMTGRRNKNVRDGKYNSKCTVWRTR